MLEFTLPDMSCGHCASSVAQVCKLVDPTAKVEVNLKTKQVKVESVEPREEFVHALSEAGYAPA